MDTLLLMLLLAILGVVFVATRKPKQSRAKTTRTKPVEAHHNTSLPKASAKWRAVSIATGAGACQAALSMSGKVHLMSEAPALPLKQCVTAVCRCKYVHHTDRRRGDQDRRVPFGLQSELRGIKGTEEERRKRRGRRAEDMNPVGA